jgi:hypothetical protein
MKASRVLVRVSDGLVWEANRQLSDLLAAGTPAGVATEFWRSGELAVWCIEGRWAAACREATETGFASFEAAARRAVAMQQATDGAPQPESRASA